MNFLIYQKAHSNLPGPPSAHLRRSSTGNEHCAGIQNENGSTASWKIIDPHRCARLNRRYFQRGQNSPRSKVLMCMNRLDQRSRAAFLLSAGRSLRRTRAQGYLPANRIQFCARRGGGRSRFEECLELAAAIQASARLCSGSFDRKNLETF